MTSNGVRHRELQVCEDEQSKTVLLGCVTCEVDDEGNNVEEETINKVELGEEGT